MSMLNGTPHPRLAALGLLAALTAVVLVAVVLDPARQRTLATPPSAVSVGWANEAANIRSTPPDVSIRAALPARNDGEGAVDAALGDLERAFEAASEEHLDVIAASRLPDIVRRDPRKAARFIELRSPSKHRAVLVRHFSRLWGESDAEGALAWAQALPDAQESTLARRAVCLSLGLTRPADAVVRCAATEADAAEFQGIFQAWVQSDPASASEWLAAQPASASLDKLRLRYAHVVAKTNPVEALRLTQQGFSAPADRDDAVLAVLHQWGLQDPAAARDWVGNYAPSDLKARALAEIDGLESYAASR
jgi:hypothetical protein